MFRSFRNSSWGRFVNRRFFSRVRTSSKFGRFTLSSNRSGVSFVVKDKFGTLLQCGVVFLGTAALLSFFNVVSAEPPHQTKPQTPPQLPSSLDLKTKTEPSSNKAVDFLTSLVEDVSVGSLLGLAAGFALRILGKGLLFVLGIELIILQYLAWKDLIRINWAKFIDSSNKYLDRRKEYVRLFVRLLTYKIPFKVGFVGGLYIGLTNPFK